ncbi:MAG TPA: hypothetical protein VGX03_02260 [Candidatus Binatia bacterium]|nr:hypothetical protein [Candidatus Binatia bacterium]
MRRRGVETLTTEEPDDLSGHVRLCGGAGWATAGSTRNRLAARWRFCLNPKGHSWAARSELRRKTLAWIIQECLQKYDWMHFEIIGDIPDIELIATGPRIRILPLLRRRYGRGRWRKLKGKALVRLADGTVRRAELHWFEAHGIGKRKMRIKRFLD